uniref:Uncharacterized protein n=1 Tax=Amphimedon queenslandica TaxID=400682 RepID=A0A1X7SVQ1_AMPQE
MAANGSTMLDHGVVLRALRSKTTTLSLDNTKIDALPPSLTKLTFLTKFSAKNNSLTDHGLSPALKSLTKLRAINLGCNKLSCLPVCFMEMPGLHNIHLFSNEIEQLDEDVLECLTEVIVLNLNGNLIDHLPPAIASLNNLTTLGIASNRLKFIPQEISHLSSLVVLHVEDNQLQHSSAVAHRYESWIFLAIRYNSFLKRY